MNGAANFRNASKAEGVCVNTFGSSSGTQILDPCFSKKLVKFLERPWLSTMCTLRRLKCAHFWAQFVPQRLWSALCGRLERN